MKHHIKSSILEVAKITGLNPRIEVEKILSYLSEQELEDLDLVYKKWVDDRIKQFEEAIVFVGQFETVAELNTVPKEDLEDGSYAYVGSGNNFAVYYFDAISQNWYSSLILPANIIQALLEANDPDGENPFATLADVGGGTGLPQNILDALNNALDPSGSNPYITLNFLIATLQSYDLQTTERLIEIDFELINNTEGIIRTAKWYNPVNVLRQLSNVQKSFSGLAPAGLLRWDVGVGMPDGTEQLLTSGNLASPTRPEIPAGAVVLYDILWNDETAIVSPGNPNTVWSLIRYGTRIEPGTNGKWAKIYDGPLTFVNNYQFQLAYAATGYTQQKVGVLNVGILCDQNSNIRGQDLLFSAVEEHAEVGDFRLVESGGRVRLYHKSHEYWGRIRWRVVFQNEAVNLDDFINNAPYEDLSDVATQWESQPYGGGGGEPVDLSQYYKKEFIDSLDSTGNNILWERPRTYGSRSNPLTASNYTETNPAPGEERKGLVQKLFVQGANFNPPNTWYKLDDGVNYDPAKVNLITVEYFSANNKTYNIMQYV